ncbi:response regulator receiver [Gemmatirosa kalamazoonensis]|uniref:Response regulator receiver n=1 Tax=Gemmatirosa kalamazoonensis TaxID=861299 RepID=W0RLU8_9BACT|nr:response regulator receiver [Gemmatirosa kalamazoonensis]
MSSRPPLLTTPASSVPIIVPDTLAVSTVPQRALVVDDEPRLRQVLVRLMTRDGFECADAANGDEAIRQLERTPVTLVMSDLRMPGTDGVELLRTIRERWPNTAVVMITAVSDVDVAVRCLALGAMDYLTKPFHLEEVRARVRQALDKRRLLLENREHQLRLEARVAEQARSLESLFLASMQSLADALEVKDPYTRGHSIRVSLYSVSIAHALGLGTDVIRQIELGGHLHDIGKIGVRESVLKKPGPLTEEEYRHIMTHPVVGWKLLNPLLSDMPLALDIVRSHHERVDGCGMPDGLAGDAIPLVARIAAVADSFDAMTSDRPYRVGLSMAAARQELWRCAGTQYDPDVVAAFDAAVEEGEISIGA